MSRIFEASITSAKDIISTVKKNYDIQISPGTIYPVFLRMEKEGDIERLPKKTHSLFVLTKKGKEKGVYFRDNIDRFYEIINDLIQ